MKIGDTILSVSKIKDIKYNDYNLIIEVFYGNRVFLEKFREKNEYLFNKNLIEKEIKIYREKNQNIFKINEQLWSN